MRNISSSVLTLLLAAGLTDWAGATTYTVGVNTFVVDANSLSPTPVPGDTVVITPSAGRGTITFKNFIGSAANPIIFKNGAGKVVISSTTGSTGIGFSGCRYFRLTGTGSASFPYGIQINVTKSGSMGVSCGGLSSDLEVDHVEVMACGFAGIMCKTDPGPDGFAQRGNFTQYNTSVHDNYVHHTGGEGLYIGNSFYSSGESVTNSDGSVVIAYPHNLVGVRIYNNIVEHTGWDGIQVGCAVSDCTIYNNYINDSGTKNASGQNQCIQINPGTTGKIYNNWVQNGYGTGVFMLGKGGNQVFNNVIWNVAGSGIFCDDRATDAGTGFYFNNNTIVNTGGDGIRFYSKLSTGSTFYNNVVVNPGSTKYHVIFAGAQLLISNNYETMTVEAVGFLNAADGDFHLTAGSPAIDVALNLTGTGVTLDYDGNARPSGPAFDIGAYEFPALFGQNFSSSTVVGSYVNASAPNSGQFNDISAETHGGSWSIVSGVLTLNRTSATATLADDDAGLTRFTDFAVTPAVLECSLDFGINSWANSQNDALTLEIGNFTALSDYGSSTPSANVFARVAIDGAGGAGFYYEVNGVQSGVYPTNGGQMRTLKIFLNKSGASQTYTGPNGSSYSLSNNFLSVWVDTTPIFTNVAATNGGSSKLTDLRIRTPFAVGGIWKFDNFQVFNTLP